jgi:cytidine deaminase
MISYGENRHKPNTLSTIHAEENAIRKLPPIKKKKNNNKNPIKLDLLVIRVASQMGNSKPCIHCLLKLRELPSRGYSVRRVFFSTSSGAIVRYSLDYLLNEEDPHVSSFYESTGFRLKVK